MPTFKEYYEKFEKMQIFMFNDLKNASIKSGANFLIGMGLLNYTEILGSFSGENLCGKRFNFVFNELLPNSYKDVFDKIEILRTHPPYDTQTNPTPAYDILRGYDLNMM